MYLYRFTHEPSRSNSERFGFPAGASDVDFGVAHADDLLLLFRNFNGLNGSAVTPEDLAAQVGSLTLTWQPCAAKSFTKGAFSTQNANLV